MYLEQRTKFFSDRLDIESLSLSNNSTSTSKKNSNQDELLQYVCCLLLRHITQLVCNGHAIYEVGNCETDLDDDEGESIVYEYWCNKIAIIDKEMQKMYYSCNKNEIVTVQYSYISGPVVNNSQFRIATAIYPSASMMNHSCDPTVINSFYNQRYFLLLHEHF